MDPVGRVPFKFEERGDQVYFIGPLRILYLAAIFFAGMVNGQQVQIVDCIRAFVRIKLMMMMISKFRTAMHQKLPATADVQYGAKAVVTCKIKKVLQNHCIKKS